MVNAFRRRSSTIKGHFVYEKEELKFLSFMLLVISHTYSNALDIFYLDDKE
jgi:hypothetical protein